MKRYFLILLPEDPAKKAKIEEFSEDRAAAIDKYSKLREQGCPAGFGEAILTSNTSLHKHVEVIPTARLQEQAGADRSRSAREIEDRRQARIKDLKARRAEIDSTLSELGVEEPVEATPPADPASSEQGDPENQQTSLV